MYDAFLLLSLIALLASPYLLNAWSDWIELRAERRKTKLATTPFTLLNQSR